ncbi:MAG: hypothetical protein JW751_08865 [Polyangiaceae bacterium]|nr:hypothetical protein [Polyangiaceae bacterium]
MTDWVSIEDGFPNGIGSEGGQIRSDEEHPLGARITLEEGGINAPWAITCGIYGWMVHTVFCVSEAEGRAKMAEEMKSRLDAIMEMIPLKDAPDAEAAEKRAVEALGTFVDDF